MECISVTPSFLMKKIFLSVFIASKMQCAGLSSQFQPKGLFSKKIADY